MSTPHTPGPWTAQPTAGHDRHGQTAIYAQESGKDIAIVYDGDADADLIAAAPAMRAALESSLNVLTTSYNYEHGDPETVGAVMDIEAALKLTKGGR